MNFSKILLSIILVTSVLTCGKTKAQHFTQTQNGVKFEIFSNFSEPPTLGDESNFVSYKVTNQIFGSSSSNYNVTMWVSIQEQIRSDDLSATGTLNANITFGNPMTNSGGVLFRLPNPNTMGPAPKLSGDNRSAADWIGKDLYCTLCVNVGITDNCVVARAVIHPKSPIFFATPHEETVNQAKFYWAALPKDRESKSIGAGHRVTVKHQSTGVEVVNTYIPQVPEPELVLFNNIERNLLTLDQAALEPGEAYKVNIEACGANDGTICSAPDPNATHPNNLPKYTENIRAFALFPEPSVNAQLNVAVNWRQFSDTTKGYRLYRCEVDTTNLLTDCETIVRSNTNISFTDSDNSIEPGRRYRYEISACLDDSACNSGSVIKTGITETVTIPGDRLVTPDAYEDDDNPKRLTKTSQSIGATVNQQRSFHTENDADWTKIVLNSGTRQLDVSTSSSLENINTKVGLANAEGELIACAYGNPNVVTSHARLVLPNLPSGDYFLRVTQEYVGINLHPVEQYALDVEILVNSTGERIDQPCNDEDQDAFELAFESNTTIVPMIDLLLE